MADFRRIIDFDAVLDKPHFNQPLKRKSPVGGPCRAPESLPMTSVPTSQTHRWNVLLVALGTSVAALDTTVSVASAICPARSRLDDSGLPGTSSTALPWPAVRAIAARRSGSRPNFSEFRAAAELLFLIPHGLSGMGVFILGNFGLFGIARVKTVAEVVVRKLTSGPAASDRGQSELIVKLAAHLNCESLPAIRRQRLLREAVLFDRIVSDPESSHFKRGLSRLLGLTPEQALAVALAYTECPKPLQLALGVRLKHLGMQAAPGQLQAFLKLIPRMEERIPSAVQPLLTQHPELREWIQRARSELTKNPSEVLIHIDGETASGSQLTGGGHLLIGFEKLADVALSKWPKTDREAFERAVAALDPEEAKRTIEFMYGRMGFDLSGSRWTKFFLIDQILWRIETKPNGVRCFRVPRRYFNSAAWKNTIASAKCGISPIGGKSLFPPTWSQTDILDAIAAVLDHPEPFILRLASKGGKPHFYLRAEINGVDVEVGVAGGRVSTAFPSWRQHRPDSIGEAYEEWFTEWDRLREGLEWCPAIENFSDKVQFPNGFISAYFGECPPGLTATEWETLELWLRPSRVRDAPDQVEALTLQLTVFDFLERSRVVRELEGCSGPVG